MSRFIDLADVALTGRCKAVLDELGASVSMEVDTLQTAQEVAFKIELVKKAYAKEGEIDHLISTIRELVKEVMYGDLIKVLLELDIALYDRNYDLAREKVSWLLEEVGK